MLNYSEPIYKIYKPEIWKNDWADLIRYKFITPKAHVPDCDDCKESRDSYKIYDYFSAEEAFYRGDTLTSAFTVFKGYLAARIGAGGDVAKELKKFLDVTGNHCLCTRSMTGPNLKNYFKKEVSDADKGDKEGIAFVEAVGAAFQDNDDLGKQAGRFLKNYITIGNFLPVPQGVNGLRSNYGKWDTVDRMLWVLYHYFHAGRKCEFDSKLIDLFTTGPKLRSTIQNCEKWFRVLGVDELGHENWLKFLEKTNLRVKSLVDEEHEQRPKALRTGKVIDDDQFDGGSLLPRSLDEYRLFFENANDYIEERIKLCNEKLQENG